ncbi:MAG: ATP-binding protein [Bacilli bacterium]
MAYNLINEFRLINKKNVFGDNRLDLFEKYGVEAAITDFSILLGGIYFDTNTIDGRGLIHRTGSWWLEDYDGINQVFRVDGYGLCDTSHVNTRFNGIRPCIPFYTISSECSNLSGGINGVNEVLFGEYPQMAVDKDLSTELEIKFNDGDLLPTGKEYTTDSVYYQDIDKKFSLRTHTEYEYNGNKYIRFVADENGDGKVLSNGMTVELGKPYWICVEPITWLVDDDKQLAISKKIISSGIQFSSSRYYGDLFASSLIDQFLSQYLSKDIIPSNVNNLTNTSNTVNLPVLDVDDVTNEDVIDEFERKLSDVDSSNVKDSSINMTLINPYDFDLDSVSEDEIIRGCIDSGVPVFLHGASSEGKSARVKQIDPKLIKLSLAGITPEKLNGRSVYNSLRDTMEDKKPTWLERLESICSSEPDLNHILFLDEISNALPSIQGMVYHLVLDREVNDRWKLPDNARIVLAGNEMKDSLAANKVVEPLFNRCAHVYIKTRLSDWLIWASETGIHPSIYSFMVYKNGAALRSKFDGEKPNADPRKWEMASKVLYSTGQPEMIRSLVGEEITREFCEFCNQKVITLDDVLKGNYDNNFISNLNTAEKYATVVGLSYVNKDNLEIVRDFVNNLGQEFVSVFDSIWCSGNEERLEIIAEMKMNQKVKKL